jgi:hypothetical protein
VRRSAAKAGFSTNALYARRMLDPAFEAQWEAAKAQCLARNDMLLIDSVPRTLDPETSDAADDLAKPTIAEAIQIARLYRPAEEKPARGAKAAKAAKAAEEEEAPMRSGAEIFDELSRRLEDIAREKADSKLAEGWSRDEEGHWIPPGWERKDDSA